MKLIEAMKKVKANQEKIIDLQQKISKHCANNSHETPEYGDNTEEKVRGWCQACEDLSSQNILLLVGIQRTNLATQVSIELGGKTVTKSIAEWIWRRREYAKWDEKTWKCLTDRNLKEGQIPTSTGPAVEIKIVRHYDPVVRDEKVDLYHNEPRTIDATLEVTNAVTDLIVA